MRPGTIAAALCLAILSACASEQPVRISAYRDGAFTTSGVKTYALDSAQAAADDATTRTLDEALAAQGLRSASANRADYLIKLGYATRPGNVRVQATCSAAPESACDDIEAPKGLFERKRYVHALTVQFIGKATGAIVYQVSVTHADRDPVGNAALPALMKCAFNRFPLQNADRRELVDPARCD
ncbi:DUF4136 domain-containing protein [Caballeronia sp. dw_276]|uniref:DUF4136 domain-containing protein n=1 Tax=Caballeronia sp. dw_276 TaxID=2719795 RepID=UPI001BD3D519